MVKQKKSSTISAKTAMEALLKAGYETHAPTDRRIRPTERHNHAKNPGVELSASGKSIKLFYNGESREENRVAEIFVPAKGMLSIKEADTLQKLTKVTFSNFDR
jgi:hypothetical protein